MRSQQNLLPSTTPSRQVKLAYLSPPACGAQERIWERDGHMPHYLEQNLASSSASSPLTRPVCCHQDWKHDQRNDRRPPNHEGDDDEDEPGVLGVPRPGIQAARGKLSFWPVHQPAAIEAGPARMKRVLPITRALLRLRNPPPQSQPPKWGRSAQQVRPSADADTAVARP